MPNDELRLELATIKPKYSLDEPVEVRVHLYNLGDEPVHVNGRLAASPGTSGEITFDLNGPSGKIPFSARVNVGKPEAGDFVILAPFTGVSRQDELSIYFPFEEPGKYILKARYSNKWDGKDFGVKAWTGSLESTQVTFEVVE